MCPWGRLIHSGSLGSFGFALGVVGFIRDCWVHSGALWGSSGSLGVVAYIRVRPGRYWVHSGLLGSFAYTLLVARFTHVHHSVVRFISGHWVHSGEPWGS